MKKAVNHNKIGREKRERESQQWSGRRREREKSHFLAVG
jgi:hypothetical protein